MSYIIDSKVPTGTGYVPRSYIITSITICWKGRKICKCVGCLLVFRDEFKDFGASFLICHYHRAVDIGSPCGLFIVVTALNNS